MSNPKKIEDNSAIKVSYRNLSIIFLIICVTAVAMSFIYYGRLSSTIKDESKNYLREVSNRVGSNINRIINDNYAVLYSMSSVIEALNLDTMPEVSEALQEQKAYWNYESILVIDENGKAYGLDNKEVFLNISTNMREDILSGKPSMSATQMVNNHEYIIFAVPLNDRVIDNKNMKAIAACYDPSSFERTLSMTSFDEKAYSQIVTKTGTVVTRPTSQHAMKTGYNIFSTIETAQLDPDSNMKFVMADIQSGNANQIGFTIDNVHRYMVYTPLDLDQWYLLTFVPVSAINARSDLLLKSTLIICGLIALTFSGLIALLIYTFTTNKRKLEELAYVDSITGGNTIQRFYQIAQASIDNAPVEVKYALIYTNMEKFKVLNEQIGRHNCDTILKHFYNFIAAYLKDGESIGRLSADNFCLLLQFDGEKQLIERFAAWQKNAEDYVINGQMPWPLPTTQLGIYVIDNTFLTFPQMIDRAKLALKELSRSLDGKLRYAFYDDEVRRQLLREKTLEDMMEQSLIDNEFQVYLQPKYHLPDETIGGAEALIRWDSKTQGMIFPNEFIPLFEKNGFIVRSDLWVFEDVCKTIRSWIDRGLPLIKISVNCSRIHFRDANFLVPYCNIAAKYDIPRGYIEIELTESVVLENVDKLTKIIDDIRDAGFSCSMDDFGSGYSSLNMIQSIPVDTLKLDRIFFHSNSGDAARTEAVVQSIVSMARALNMETVAEGVEVRDQVEMLKRVGCDYIQGYVFAKPMKISAFEELAFGDNN